MEDGGTWMRIEGILQNLFGGKTLVLSAIGLGRKTDLNLE